MPAPHPVCSPTPPLGAPHEAAERLVALTVGRPSGCLGLRRRRRPQAAACPSLFSLIQPTLDRHDRGDRSALAPGPLPDRVFTRLVRQVIADLDTRPPAIPARVRTSSHWQVTRVACERIDGDHDLAWRAGELRRAAAAAEAAMELHYSRLVTDVAIRSSARGRSEPPARPGSPEALRRLRQALRPFPYTGNYELLVQAEVAGLGDTGPDTHLTFCGAGPLPLTGIFWHHLTGATVTLVDIDPEAAIAARHLIDALAGLGALDGDAFEVLVTDAGHLAPPPGAVLAASLLPMTTVIDLADRWLHPGRASDRRPGPLLVRSATGLVARLVYDRVDADALVRLGASHQRTVVPWSMVSNDPALPTDIAIGADGSVPISRAPHGVLNLTEIFSPLTGTPPSSAPHTRHSPLQPLHGEV